MTVFGYYIFFGFVLFATSTYSEWDEVMKSICKYSDHVVFIWSSLFFSCIIYIFIYPFLILAKLIYKLIK